MLMLGLRGQTQHWVSCSIMAGYLPVEHDIWPVLDCEKCTACTLQASAEIVRCVERLRQM